MFKIFKYIVDGRQEVQMENNLKIKLCDKDIVEIYIQKAPYFSECTIQPDDSQKSYFCKSFKQEEI